VFGPSPEGYYLARFAGVLFYHFAVYHLNKLKVMPSHSGIARFDVGA
jgi:hypothetical protein